ncbi:Predicted oxidoreductase [Streptomyces sp. 2224.1]|uniref:aldo/keto reductase n=1 Tax=unclassified Streptomyces TaxID=2593676 RepID=UPI0008800C8E|nr:MULTISPECIES: aldo/keto reductase [unclassified Streptomyces]PBC83938.1 aryl-alcohol dehydrogenase-like predicted oxidoreductase [Streptomyces sp. 2321.6]SDR36931.1 Predicted oxidoreductase [Streptomyces sp. KS_16]SEB87912.1 Predicted oxidoreductase [Streptomyces sp. 2224.1]SED14178.1 Predicted oxidoreductase [Streptomyces sp. 2133.1]SNC70016.1 Predicted oxidoreductase [Streptomyces sp. 2114.4]
MWETKLADGFSVSALGLGCSSMSYGYGSGQRDDEESTRVIHRSLDLGVNLFDTADVYGPFTNEELLGRALEHHGHEANIATKCGLIAQPDGRFVRDGRPEHLRRACEASLRRLRTDTIDLYQLHRVDPAVPLAETWGALGELVTEGKVRALGISHATCEELDQIHAIFPITTVQYELSVWAPQSKRDILPWCRRNGVGFLAFAPIGRGFLTGKVSHERLHTGDSRVRDPRFRAEAMRSNGVILDGLREVAARHDGATASQVAIAWVLAQGPGVVPIPGTRHLRWLEENVAAAELRLTDADLSRLESLPATVGEMCWDSVRAEYPSRTDIREATGVRESAGPGDERAGGA